MESYKILLKNSVNKDIRKIDKTMIPKILSGIENLANNPFSNSVKKLIGSSNTYRLRVSEYRIIFILNEVDKEIVIQKVRHRKNAYK